MNNIAVLIDFTEGSKAALKQAASIAQKAKANLFAVHIVATQDKVEQVEAELATFLNSSNITNIEVKPIIGVGSLAPACNSTFNKINADLVLICTHGVKGMFQQLFGAQILKLIQAISYPCLVISEHTKVDLSEVKSILFPIGPHPDFMIKIKQTTTLAKFLNASILIYEIDRNGADPEHWLSKNLEASRKYFTENEISFSKVLEELSSFSVGFSRQTLDYASKNSIPIMSMMATVSNNDNLFGYGDKENFLVNNHGISILTCNA